MSSNDTRHVQTELNKDEYEQFQKFAEKRDLSLKEAGHRALLEWIERRQDVDPTDPAFTVLDEIEDHSLSTTETDAREEDDLVEEWHGRDASISLADDPASR
ncbi:hypothetical protein Huta_2376 [Halorhabdus utahensis DSM 12940]|uniref:Uncharacterized protein n=1 Tax=Halorhabdus utahensis (strain DSM 12940 / JCM 11049 / AX-2) TaxID=519442 RepID=C7NVL9_HALUD|nr:hypothetical protein [Halorhabdus utahensis]ACV12542.1 hypothetical protein Huta_2376 [Halorhabdus utahensis DSM 12940]